MDILPGRRLIQELDELLPDLQRWHEVANGSPHNGAPDAEMAARIPAVMARLTPIFAEMRERGFTLPTAPPLWEDHRGWVNVVVPYLQVHREVIAGADKPSMLDRLRRWVGSLGKGRSAAPAVPSLRETVNPVEVSLQHYRSGLTEAELLYWCGPPERFQECIAKLSFWFGALIAQVEYGGPYMVDPIKETPLIRDVLEVVVVPRLAQHGFVAPDVREWEEDPLAWYHGWQAYLAKVQPHVLSNAAAGVA